MPASMGDSIPVKPEAKKPEAKVVAQPPKLEKAVMANFAAAPLAIGKGESLEKVVTDMITGKSNMTLEEAFMGTPFGDSVDKILKLIDEELIPKVQQAHDADQQELDDLAASLATCAESKKSNIEVADESKEKFDEFAPLHQTCRNGEAGKKTEMEECYSDLANQKKLKEEKCAAFDTTD